MSKKRGKVPPTAGNGARAPAADSPSLDRWLLGAMAALFVGRPLLASEGVSWLGDGLPWVMLWFVLAALLALRATRRRRLARPLGWLDGAVWLLIGWHTLAAIVALGSGASPRPAVNMLWEWAGLGLSFFCARQLIRGQPEARGMIAAMIALAVGLSALGYEQYFVQNPALRAAYQSDPDAIARSAGWDVPAGSAERMQFESRLQSSEPLATFALTNSLAGLLLPWLVVAAALASAAARERLGRAWLWRLAALAATLCGCLALTQCRSAWIGLAVGCLGLVATSGGARRAWRKHRTIVIAGLAVAALAAVAGGVALAAGFAPQLLAGARRSLGFRRQYWQASLSLIHDYPWFGCGPGNFQDFYTAYKLPQASEEIRDPHNFLFELAATAGIPAALAMLGVLVLFFGRLWRAGAFWPIAAADSVATANPVATDNPAATVGSVDDAASLPAIAWGAAGGLVLAEALGLLDVVPLGVDRLAICGIAAAAGAWLLGPWITRGKLPASCLAMAALAQAIHLLAAGGIAYPGVAGSFWLLLATATNLVEGPASTGLDHPTGLAASATVNAWRRLEPIVVLTLIAVGGFAAFVTGYSPVLSRNTLLGQVELVDARQPDQAARRRELLLAAAKADSLSDEPPRQLAQLARQALLGAWSADDKRVFDGAVGALLRLRPHSSSTWLEAADWYLELYARHGDRGDLASAIRLAKEAVRLYPNSARPRATLAQSYAANRQTVSAQDEAATACELDDQTPHPDKKLAAAVRRRMETLAVGDR